ncbi:hypothetical protein Ahy_B10g100973 [Arachis hypogaea]|uniref:Transposase MuDR plant domain-containing protein n=1 Tax=Arachis hypogaea TaxID=3818 RepID=A0A444WY66_ARAHY|nr:hypothetical protein Ahy_B10g100973 [Arachis hypogaea]
MKGAIHNEKKMTVTTKKSSYPTMTCWEETRPPTRKFRLEQARKCYSTYTRVPFVQDGESAVEIEFSSRESVVMAIKNYTIFSGVDYRVFESEPLTFHAKCMQYGRGCDWLIHASLIQRKCC